MANRQNEALNEIFRIAKKESLEDNRVAHVAELLSVYLKFRPEHDIAWMMYGEALRVLGRKDEAYSVLTRVFEQVCDEHKSYVAAQLAMLLELHASAAEASHWYRKATDALPKDDMCGWIWLYRGVNLSILEKFDEAVVCFEKIIAAQCPEQAEALYYMGMAYRSLGEYDKAADCLRRSVGQDPAYARAQEALEGLEGMSYTSDLIRKINGIIH